jgi:hypothetical protein
MRRPSAPLVLSSAALFVALGGPAAAQNAAERISGSRLKNNTVTSAKIKNGSLGSQDLSARSRRTLRTPRNGSVTARKLAPNSVTQTAIAPGGVGGDEIATGAVTGDEVADSSLTGRDISRLRGQAQFDFPALPPGGCAALPVNLAGGSNVANATVLVTPPSNWPGAIQVTALLGPGDDAFSVLACNFTGAPQDPGAVNFRYLVVDL